MITREQILAQMPHCLEDGSVLGPRLGLSGGYRGKVRDNFVRGNERIMIVSDRISAFDRSLGVIPFKGEALTQISKFWFEATAALVPNHLLSTPDPQVMVTREAKPIAIELVIRGRLTGSLWRDYQVSPQTKYGFTLPPGMTQYQPFDKPIITPSTKAPYGQHDEPLSPDEIVSRGLCTRDEWQQLETMAHKLFAAGQKHATSRGLVLVDTKYEFGRVGEQLILIDEIHTPDSSRYWHLDDLAERFRRNYPPRMLDKEFLRGWLLERGFKGEGEPPQIPDDIRAQVAQRYLELYQLLMGKALQVHAGPVLERVAKALA